MSSRTQYNFDADFRRLMQDDIATLLGVRDSHGLTREAVRSLRVGDHLEHDGTVFVCQQAMLTENVVEFDRLSVTSHVVFGGTVMAVSRALGVSKGLTIYAIESAMSGSLTRVLVEVSGGRVMAEVNDELRRLGWTNEELKREEIADADALDGNERE